MTADEIEHLSWQIYSGERPTEELWTLRKSSIDPQADESTLQSMSDLWSHAFHIDCLFPKIEAAKALVDIAMAGDISYPVLTNDGTMKDVLSPTEKNELFEYIAAQIGENRASVSGAALAEFADYLIGIGPQGLDAP